MSRQEAQRVGVLAAGSAEEAVGGGGHLTNFPTLGRSS
jgi:hypothetical protein